MVVSVPVDAPLRLQVTDARKTATLDLRTGMRVDDADTAAGAVYYRDRQHPDLGATYVTTGTVDTLPPPGYESARRLLEVELDHADAALSLQPWTPELGWAPEGLVWAVVSGIKARTSALDEQPIIKLTLSLSESFVLTPAGGEPVAAEPGEVDMLDAELGLGLSVSFGVPASFTKGRLAVTAAGRLEALYKDQDFPCRWTEPLPTERIAVDLAKD